MAPKDKSPKTVLMDGDRTAALPPIPDEADGHLAEGDFLDFAAGDLPAARRAAVVAHLDACKRCASVLSALSQGSKRGLPTVPVPVPVPSDVLTGEQLGEYVVGEAIAKGGMGSVYRGEQPVIGKKVAIKVLLPEVANDPDLMHRLLIEARAVNDIRHPNIIDIFGFGRTRDGRQYFVMELLDGQSLSDLMRQRRLTPDEVLVVLDQMLSGLDAAHMAGVIHRDLKPANLFVVPLPDRTWHIKLLDFGLAKRLDAPAGTAPDLVLGTPGYMAPEQIRGQPATNQSDLYAVGCIAWKLLTGKGLFDGGANVDVMVKHLHAPVPNLRKLAPEVSGSLVTLITQLLEKDPARRPQTARAVRQEVQRIRRELAGRSTVPAQAPIDEPLAAEEPVSVAQKPEVPLTRVMKPLRETQAAPVVAQAEEHEEPEAPTRPTQDAEPPLAVERPRSAVPVAALVVAAALAAALVGWWLFR